ncbi:WD40/YVTN/BNR-like repeat-containing protein [Paenibacillus chibensis]|uniref:WD40/YVTN/BNR-like repeat-containing protein n=1 Tax=Paenibacillus chibensis TaxID=59846 RepID=UPI000FD6D751|nr:hypothetical protein [Paenibacillus chibensis]MEC0372726.1 hypothetical protein [Paenibacillus chibensis]
MKKISITLLLCGLCLITACREPVSKTVSEEPDKITETSPNNTAGTNPSYLPERQKNDVADRTDTYRLDSQVQWRAEYTSGGASQEDMSLYRTADGGTTWSKLGDTTEPGSTLPRIQHTGLFFLSEQVGWIITSSPAEGDVGLYLTQDGGLNWTHQPVAIPEKFRHEQFRALPPTFFTKENGMVIADNTSHKPVILLTHTGGMDWSAVLDTDMTGVLGNIRWDFGGSNAGNNAPWKIMIGKQAWESSDQGRFWNLAADF